LPNRGNQCEDTHSPSVLAKFHFNLIFRRIYRFLQQQTYNP